MLSVLLFVAAGSGFAAAVLARRRRRAVIAAAAGTAAVVALAVVAPFDARKVAGLLLMPLGLTWIGLALTALLLWRHGQRRAAMASAGVWLLLSVAGNVWVGGALGELLERRVADIDPFAQGRFDAVVVLGGGVAVGRDGNVFLGDSANRPILGVELFLADRTPLLVASGPFVRLADGRRTSAAAATRSLWTSLGVPPEAVIVIEGPASTLEEAEAVAALARDRGWRRIGLLTSAWHLPRALELFRDRGIPAVPLPAGLLSPPPPPAARSLIPQEEGVTAVQKSCWELLGRLAGR